MDNSLFSLLTKLKLRIRNVKPKIESSQNADNYEDRFLLQSTIEKLSSNQIVHNQETNGKLMIDNLVNKINAVLDLNDLQTQTSLYCVCGCTTQWIVDLYPPTIREDKSDTLCKSDWVGFYLQLADFDANCQKIRRPSGTFANEKMPIHVRCQCQVISEQYQTLITQDEFCVVLQTGFSCGTDQLYQQKESCLDGFENTIGVKILLDIEWAILKPYNNRKACENQPQINRKASCINVQWTIKHWSHWVGQRLCSPLFGRSSALWGMILYLDNVDKIEICLQLLGIDDYAILHNVSARLDILNENTLSDSSLLQQVTTFGLGGLFKWSVPTRKNHLEQIESLKFAIEIMYDEESQDGSWDYCASLINVT